MFIEFDFFVVVVCVVESERKKKDKRNLILSDRFEEAVFLFYDFIQFSSFLYYWMLLRNRYALMILSVLAFESISIYLFSIICLVHTMFYQNIFISCWQKKNMLDVDRYTRYKIMWIQVIWFSLLKESKKKNSIHHIIHSI